MNNRLKDIKQCWERPSKRKPQTRDDILWLVSEVERLSLIIEFLQERYIYLPKPVSVRELDIETEYDLQKDSINGIPVYHNSNVYCIDLLDELATWWNSTRGVK